MVPFAASLAPKTFQIAHVPGEPPEPGNEPFQGNTRPSRFVIPSLLSGQALSAAKDLCAHRDPSPSFPSGLGLMRSG